ncbi:MAG: hypothetical protein H9847_07165 [Candidatus Anaerobiospirillum pullicola]|uniref:Flagellar protein FliT n=1 Tax=Candidatus Anaerobiospirillum pullicola TaxID=2838451 RepID=A0A948TGT4_9GAMM|nr:hypothetical protein [Candidatus Anaerobiospirillum pullicola]
MNQELLDLAKQIDDNEDAISDALENEEFDKAVELSNEKVKLFKRLYELSETIEDKTELNEYLNSLYEVTQEQRDILNSEHNKMRSQLRGINRGSKGQKAYQQVRAYARTKTIFG